MAANVLNSRRAIEVSVYAVRAFVRLRETLTLHKELASRLADLERKIESHDEGIRTLFEAIRQLMAPPEKGRRFIGVRMKDSRCPCRLSLSPRWFS